MGDDKRLREFTRVQPAGGAPSSREFVSSQQRLEDAIAAIVRVLQAAGLLTPTQAADLTDGGQTALHKHDHNVQDNLAVGDVHTQYALLAGRSGGQTVIGGTAASNTLKLRPTSHATKGKLYLNSADTIVVDDVNNRVGVNNASPACPLQVDCVDSGAVYVAKFFHPAVTDGNDLYVGIGKAEAANQGLTIGHHYDTDGATSSYAHITYYGDAAGAGINLKTGGKIGLGKQPTVALDVNGVAAFSGGIQQGAWTAVTFQNSWVDFGAPHPACAYTKDSQGYVHLRGVAKSGTAYNATIFTLPSGYRPSERRVFIVAMNDSWAEMFVDSSGAVYVYTGGAVSTSGVSLQGVIFEVA